VSVNQLRRLNWSKSRQWQWVEDYCHWLDDGCSPLQAAEAMRLSATQYKLVLEQQMALRLAECLRAGLPMTNALKGWLHPGLLDVFTLGQQQDCLTELLQQFRTFERRRHQLVMSLWKQRVYPLFVLLLVLIATAVAGESYFPRLLTYSPVAVEHWSVKAVTLLASVLVNWGVLLVVCVIGIAGAYRWLGQHWAGRWRIKLERLGLFGYSRAMGAVWVTQMLALLLRHRLSLQDGLRQLEPLAGRYVGSHLQMMSQHLARGERQLARVMGTGLLPKQLLFRLHNSSQRNRAVDGLWRTALRSDKAIRAELMSRQRLLLGVVYLAIVGLLMVLIQAAGEIMQQLLMA
jgi:type II secretory pathway component PulF